MLSLWWPAVAAIVSGTILVAIGVTAWLISPPKADARRAALLVVFQGLGLSFAFGWYSLASDVGLAAGFAGVAWVAFTALLPVELLFLSTLRTRWANWLRTQWLQRTLWVLVPVGAVLPLLAGDLYGGEWTAAADHRWVAAPAPLGTVVPLLHGVFAVLGFVLAIRQLRESPAEPLERRRAQAYLAAFIIRDLSWAILLLVLVPLGADLALPSAWLTLQHAVFEFLFVVILTYGALSVHLFDIDVKMRYAVNGASVAALLTAVYFVASEIIESWLPTQSTIGSLGGAITVALFLLPARYLGQRLANRLLPNARRDLNRRRGQVYRSAYRAALRDGKITTKEKAMLLDLRDSLGLSASEASRLET